MAFALFDACDAMGVFITFWTDQPSRGKNGLGVGRYSCSTGVDGVGAILPTDCSCEAAL